MKKMWLVLLLVLLLTPTVLAQKQYHLKLLAVQENSNGSLTGSGADLFLELKEGSGRVFLDTFPVTKMDTQISTRFAKEIACHQYQLPCYKYDFIYTIKASSNIIGGPSAGAAIAALTTIAVLDLDYNDGDTAITGTINSGGIIGPVGGTKQKLEAASELGLKKVLIAKGTAATSLLENSSQQNKTESPFNLTKYAAENLSLQVLEVSDLDEVIFALSGENLNHKEVQIEESQDYTEIMGDLRDLLCSRVEKIEMELYREGVSINETVAARVAEQKEKADNATLSKDYYSAASYCFTANIALRTHYYNFKKPDLPFLWERFLQLEKKTDSLEKNLSQQQIKTIADLQTLMIVKERLSDVQDQISAFRQQPAESTETTEAPDSYALLSYAEERYFSAVAWMHFFSMEGKHLILDQEHLQQSCLQKILEAEERHQYVGLFIGEDNIISIAKKISVAKEASSKKNYELCLMKAIQAKGDANAVLSSLGLAREELSNVLQSKTTAVKRVIAENSAEKTFPLLGYSYFRYADSLKEQEPVTALFYMEYALEMSDLSIYFPEEKRWLEKIYGHPFFNSDLLQGLGIGIIIGLVLSVFVGKNKKWKKFWKK